MKTVLQSKLRPFRGDTKKGLGGLGVGITLTRFSKVLLCAKGQCNFVFIQTVLFRLKVSPATCARPFSADRPKWSRVRKFTLKTKVGVVDYNVIGNGITVKE